MAIDTNKNDGWATLGRIALRTDGRSYKSKDLANVTDLNEFRNRCKNMADVLFADDDIHSEAELDMAILDLIQRAKTVARHLKLHDAMEVAHQVGMAIHGSAQR
jgi:hypothetical protein